MLPGTGPGQSGTSRVLWIETALDFHEVAVKPVKPHQRNAKFAAAEQD